MTSISLLLGAGFSVNKGYPTANQLNNKITALKASDFTVAPQGSVCWLKDGQKDIFGYDQNNIFKLFTLKLIAFYAAKHQFNYEQFFDYYTNINKEPDLRFIEFCDTFREDHKIKDDNINLSVGTIVYSIKLYQASSLIEMEHVFIKTFITWAITEDIMAFWVVYKLGAKSKLST